MSLTRRERVPCTCGAPLDVRIAESLNGERHPELKQAVLDRELHVFRCDLCEAPLVVEAYVMYFDFARRQFFCTYPRHERAHAAEAAAEVTRAFQTWLVERAPALVRDHASEFLVRACFGYEELREKLVIDDGGLSDLVIEALKLELMTADPWFETAGVMTVRLDEVLPDGALRFVPEWLEPPPEVEPRIAVVSRGAYDAVDARFDDILVHHPALAKGPHVSMLRLVDWSPAITTPVR